jgi:ApaG protein
MSVSVSNGIKIQVTTSFEPSFSNVIENNYYFSYTITITNYNNFSVQLLRRYWLIIDAFFHHREVDGEGVVGQQPVILPSESYSYSSACDLRAPIGKMLGHYLFKNTYSHQTFEATIPAFVLCYPEVNN